MPVYSRKISKRPKSKRPKSKSSKSKRPKSKRPKSKRSINNKRKVMKLRGVGNSKKNNNKLKIDFDCESLNKDLLQFWKEYWGNFTVLQKQQILTNLASCSNDITDPIYKKFYYSHLNSMSQPPTEGNDEFLLKIQKLKH